MKIIKGKKTGFVYILAKGRGVKESLLLTSIPALVSFLQTGPKLLLPSRMEDGVGGCSGVNRARNLNAGRGGVLGSPLCGLSNPPAGADEHRVLLSCGKLPTLWQGNGGPHVHGSCLLSSY